MRRRTFKMEFGEGKSVSVVVEGEIDDEMLKAVESYIARHRRRIVCGINLDPEPPVTTFTQG